MGRSSGLPKTGGRKLGTPNKKTAFLTEALEALKCDVPASIVEILPALPPEKRVDVLLQLMGYLYPKRKAVEVLESQSNFLAPLDFSCFETK